MWGTTRIFPLRPQKWVNIKTAQKLAGYRDDSRYQCSIVGRMRVLTNDNNQQILHDKARRNWQCVNTRAPGKYAKCKLNSEPNECICKLNWTNRECTSGLGRLHWFTMAKDMDKWAIRQLTIDGSSTVANIAPKGNGSIWPKLIKLCRSALLPSVHWSYTQIQVQQIIIIYWKHIACHFRFGDPLNTSDRAATLVD